MVRDSHPFRLSLLPYETLALGERWSLTLQGGLDYQMGLAQPEHSWVDWPFLGLRPGCAGLQGSLRYPGDLHHSSCAGGTCLADRLLQRGGPSQPHTSLPAPSTHCNFLGPTTVFHITLLAPVCVGRFCFLPILISNQIKRGYVSIKVDFIEKNIIRDKESSFIMIRRSTHQEDIKALNVHVSNIRYSKLIKQKLVQI